MAIMAKPTVPINVYYDYDTKNESFIKMHYFLKSKGIKNNAFFLLLYDYGLKGIDPYNPNLPREMKIRILRECIINYWYFIREVVRIPEEGGQTGSGKKYALNRFNLAMGYMFVYNINQFTVTVRQAGKTVSACAWYLWCFNFSCTNSRIIFANKKHDDSKANLRTLKNLRSALPDYLRMDQVIGPDGKQIRVPNSSETLQNPINHNMITTLPGARTPSLADGAGRGATVPLLYFDEFAFLPYNSIVYAAAAPAFSTASQNAKKNGSSYGMLITTTPGDLTTKEGQFAYQMTEAATQWNESYFDLSYDKLIALMESNKQSSFMHIRYTYQMLGKGAKYFDDMVRMFGTDYAKLRREILIEWSKISDNSPFNREDLEVISSMVKQEPRYTLFFGKAGQFQMKFWDTVPLGSTYPLLIGVDVSSGIHKDASAITVVDSETTKVIATFRNNFITMPELADLIYQFVTNYAKNAIICVENNGGFGSSVLQMLLKTSIKKNLYYEIKDRMDEEVFDGSAVRRRTRRVKVYGGTSSKSTRNKLIELLHQRVQHHRDKFNSKEIYDELSTMVVKPNGKTEHAEDAHDDLVFSYLWALYIFYYGEDLATRYHLMKTEIYTDDHYDETSYSLEEEYMEGDNIDPSVFRTEDPSTQLADEQLKILNSVKSITFEDLYKKQLLEDQKSLDKIKRTPYGREAISNAYHIPLDHIEKEMKMGYVDILDDINKEFYGNDIEKDPDKDLTLTGNLSDLFNRL